MDRDLRDVLSDRIRTREDLRDLIVDLLHDRQDLRGSLRERASNWPDEDEGEEACAVAFAKKGCPRQAFQVGIMRQAKQGAAMEIGGCSRVYLHAEARSCVEFEH